MTIATGSDAMSVTVSEASPEEAAGIFEDACRRYLGVGAEDFLRAHSEGEFPDAWAKDDIARVEFFLPFAR